MRLSLSTRRATLLRGRSCEQLQRHFKVNKSMVHDKLTTFPACVTIRRKQGMLLFSGASNKSEVLSRFLDKLTRHFFSNGQGPRDLEFCRITPLGTTCQTGVNSKRAISSSIIECKVYITYYSVTPALEGFGELEGLRQRPVPLAKRRRQVISSLITQPSGMQFPGIRVEIQVPTGEGKRKVGVWFFSR